MGQHVIHIVTVPGRDPMLSKMLGLFNAHSLPPIFAQRDGAQPPLAAASVAAKFKVEVIESKFLRRSAVPSSAWLGLNESIGPRFLIRFSIDSNQLSFILTYAIAVLQFRCVFTREYCIEAFENFTLTCNQIGHRPVCIRCNNTRHIDKSSSQSFSIAW